MNSEYYITMLERFHAGFKKEKDRKGLPKTSYLQDNVPGHKSMETLHKFHEIRYALLEHPPYSSDLAPSNYYVFHSLIKILKDIILLTSMMLYSA